MVLALAAAVLAACRSSANIEELLHQLNDPDPVLSESAADTLAERQESADVQTRQQVQQALDRQDRAVVLAQLQPAGRFSLTDVKAPAGTYQVQMIGKEGHHRFRYFEIRFLARADSDDVDVTILSMRGGLAFLKHGPDARFSAEALGGAIPKIRFERYLRRALYILNAQAEPDPNTRRIYSSGDSSLALRIGDASFRGLLIGGSLRFRDPAECRLTMVWNLLKPILKDIRTPTAAEKAISMVADRLSESPACKDFCDYYRLATYAFMLGEWGGPEATPVLNRFKSLDLSYLGSWEPALQRLCIEARQKINVRSHPDLLGELGRVCLSGETPLRRWALWELQQRFPDRLHGVLRQNFSIVGRDSEVVEDYLEVLKGDPSAETRQALSALVSKHDAVIQVKLLEVLWREWSERAAQKRLESILADADHVARGMAFRVLALGPKPLWDRAAVREATEKFLKDDILFKEDSNHYLTSSLFEAAVQWDLKESGDLIARRVKDDSWILRCDAMYALLALAPDRAKQALVRESLLENPRQTQCMLPIYALIGEKDSGAALSKVSTASGEPISNMLAATFEAMAARQRGERDEWTRLARKLLQDAQLESWRFKAAEQFVSSR